MTLQQTRLICLLAAMFLASASDDVALDMINRLDTLVLPMIKEGSLNDTSLVSSRLTLLATKTATANTKKTATDAPDTALDDCLLLENGTLHAWKVCNATRASQKEDSREKCENKANNGVASYTIDKEVYKQGGANPRATCDFGTFTLEGGDNAGCESFVDDITEDANTVYESQYSTYTVAAQECQTSKETYSGTVLDCSQKGKDHRAQEEACVLKDTTLKVKLCAFQNALINKCTTLSQVKTAIEDLATQEESRNKELRTVSLTKCLFDRYAHHSEKCFKKTVMDGCEAMVNGESEEFATKAAETIHGFRQDAASHTTVFPCTAESIIIGTNGLSYEKTDANDEFSYYQQQGPRTYSASAAGAFSPAVC